MTKTYLREVAERLAAKTCDAYSYTGYGDAMWTQNILYLLEEGYNEREVEAIMRSKYTRWALDQEDGGASANTLRNFRTNSRDKALWTKKAIQELVAGTFTQEDTVEEILANYGVNVEIIQSKIAGLNQVRIFMEGGISDSSRLCHLSWNYRDGWFANTVGKWCGFGDLDRYISEMNEVRNCLIRLSDQGEKIKKNL